MIYSIKGKLLLTDFNSAVIETGGISFRCYTTVNTLRKIGQAGNEVLLFTYLNVKEDALDLFGFKETVELDCFKLLLSVSGVGPKAALSILSQLSPDKLAIAVAAKDVKAISAAQGVGKKTAERIVLELKDKLADVSGTESSAELEEISIVSQNDAFNDAVAALISLGYSQSDTARVLAKADKNLNTEQLIKFALKNFM